MTKRKPIVERRWAVAFIANPEDAPLVSDFIDCQTFRTRQDAIDYRLECQLDSQPKVFRVVPGERSQAMTERKHDATKAIGLSVDGDAIYVHVPSTFDGHRSTAVVRLTWKRIDKLRDATRTLEEGAKRD